MEELLSKFDSYFDEAESWVNIVGANWHTDDLVLRLSVSMQSETTPEFWDVTCIGVVEKSLTSVGEELLSVHSESPLLIPFTEPEVDLFFSENECNAAKLLGLISSCSVEVFGKSGYLDRFLNQEPISNGIVSSKFGKLGRFPKPLAEEIMRVLSTEPIRIKSIETGLPKLWTGSEFITYPKLLALELGSSYVVGEQFSAVRTFKE